MNIIIITAHFSTSSKLPKERCHFEACREIEMWVGNIAQNT